MKHVVKLIACLICICTAWNTTALAQQSYSIYQNISTSNGLPSNYVFSSAEDENGFLWTGTDKGLCRYDGFRWQVWDKDDGLPGNYVNAVVPDRRGGLWLGISEKGYYHFNPSTGAVTPIRLENMPLRNLLQADNEGNLYVEVSSGISTRGYLFHPQRIGRPDTVFDSRGARLSLYGDPKTKRIFSVYTDEERFLKAKQKIAYKWQVKPVPLEKDLYKQPALFISDSILLSSTNYFRFDGKGRIVAHENLFGRENSYAYTCITSEGLYVYNIKTGYYFFDRFNRKTFYDKSSGLGSDYVNHIFQTKDGTIVISTLGAGLQLIRHNYRKTFSTNNNTVRSILPGAKGWYVLNGNSIHKTGNAGTTFTALGTIAASNLTMFVSSDTLMVGTLRGIFFYKESEGKLQPSGFLELTAGISSIISQKEYLLAGTYGSGLMRFSGHSVRSRHQDYPFHIVERLAPLSYGFAALSYEDGILLTDTATGKSIHLTKKNGLNSNSVHTVYERNDTLWIGTKGGVTLNAKGRTVRSLLFPQASVQERTLACFHDASGKLWVVSNLGLYQAKEDRLLPLLSYPLVGENDAVTAAAYNPLTNELAVGSDKTFSIISLLSIRADTVTQKPTLIATMLNNKLIDEPLLSIPYSFRSVQFHLAPLSAMPFSKSRLYYKLEGFSEEWKEVKDSLRLTFSGLRPGRYTLWARSVNADGFESSPVPLKVFEVDQPFWQSWLFMALCLLLVIVTTVLVVREADRIKRRKKQAAEVLRKTLQLERERIAKDLHDHLGTNLATIIAQTDYIETRLYKGDLQRAGSTVQNLSAHTRETMNILRETIWAVQETEHSMKDFILRIRGFLQRAFDTSGMEWQVSDGVQEHLLLSPAQTLHLFRIVQEATQNILKHSGASKAAYAFSLEGNRLEVMIEDNGKGFTAPPHETNGLINIRERVKQLQGEVFFKTAPSVQIRIRIPV